jgi:hypothetical protein
MPGESLAEVASRLERDEPDLVADAVERVRREAEADHQAGSPRGRSMIRRLRDVLIERPELGLAAARGLGLEHIAVELMDGHAVDGVPGLGLDGTPLPISLAHRSRRRGAWMLAASALVLLIEAVVAGDIGSILLYVWTAVGLGLFFVGGYLVIYRVDR